MEKALGKGVARAAKESLARWILPTKRPGRGVLKGEMGAMLALERNWARRDAQQGAEGLPL